MTVPFTKDKQSIYDNEYPVNQLRISTSGYFKLMYFGGITRQVAQTVLTFRGKMQYKSIAIPQKRRKHKIGVLTKVKHYVKLVFTLRIIIKLDSKSEGALRNWKALIKQTSESGKRQASLLCRLEAKKMNVLSKQKV